MKDIPNIYSTYGCINNINSDHSNGIHAQIDPIYGWRLIGTKNPDIAKS